MKNPDFSLSINNSTHFQSGNVDIVSSFLLCCTVFFRNIFIDYFYRYSQTVLCLDVYIWWCMGFIVHCKCDLLYVSECSCDRRGTEVTHCPLGTPCFCDSTTGQCPCRRGAVGLLCDACEDGYWNLNGTSGCQPCSCDPANSLSNVCNEARAQTLSHLGWQETSLPEQIHKNQRFYIQTKSEMGWNM